MESGNPPDLDNPRAADDAGRDRWDDLAGKLAGYRGPEYRKAYLARFLSDGRRFEAEGDARGAAHCFGRVEGILEAAPAAHADAGPAGTGAASAPPLERLRRRWREEGLRGARDLLARHSRRLSPLENEAYGRRLARFASPGEPGREGGADAGSARHPAGPRSEADWMEFRRRLYRRILQSQKAALGFGAGIPKGPVGSQERPVGPYNDLHNLEGLLAFIAGMDPAWVEEFAAHYRDLSRLRDLLAGPARTGPR